MQNPLKHNIGNETKRVQSVLEIHPIQGNL